MKDSISGYDIIGDIHGEAKKLELILKKMGYSYRDHVWTHPERKAIFVGDYIDRGPEIKQTLDIIKRMVDAGEAFAIMGNHEYNALAFSYHHPNGGHIRKHSAKNILQHYETIKQFQDNTQEWDDYLAWFEKLPLFLEIDGLRVVHACWEDTHIEYLRKLNGPLTQELLLKAHDKVNSIEIWKIFEEVLKGKEIKLPDGHYFIDKDDKKRTKCRSKWWLNPEGLTLQEYLFHAPDTIRDKELPSEYKSKGYDIKAPVVFFGHYWLDPAKPKWQARNVCCLDYSVAKQGMLVAHRYYLDQPHCDDNFTAINA